MIKLPNCNYEERQRNGELFTLTITADEGYSIKLTDTDGNSIYSDLIQIPASRIDEVVANIEVVLMADVPPEPAEELDDEDEIDYKSAYEDLTEVLNNA